MAFFGQYRSALDASASLALKCGVEGDRDGAVDRSIDRSINRWWWCRKKKPQDLVNALVAMDLEQFDTEKLFALRGICPSADDLPKLKGYEGDLGKLDEV